jgi:hypothetical protein
VSKEGRDRAVGGGGGGGQGGGEGAEGGGEGGRAGGGGGGKHQRVPVPVLLCSSPRCSCRDSRNPKGQWFTCSGPLRRALLPAAAAAPGTLTLIITAAFIHSLLEANKLNHSLC